MREIKQTFIAFGIFSLSIFIVLLINSNIYITGNVISGNLDVGNCTDNQINTLWNNIFILDGSSSIKIKENQINGYCDKYLAYISNSDNELWILLGNIYDNSWNSSYRYYNNKRIFNDSIINFMYLNTTPLFISTFESASNINEKITILNDLYINSTNNLINWSIWNITKLNEIYGIIYKNNIYSNISNSSWNENVEFFNYANYINTSNNDSSVYYTLWKNKSIIVNTYSIFNYDPSFFMNFSGIIPNFEFLKNSDWNYAFNLTEYFNISSDVNLSIDYGYNNSNGIYINYIFNESFIKFKPNENFTGIREFKITAINPSGGLNVNSNKFNITIYRFNTAPNQTNKIEDIFLKNNETKNINLDNYFNDNESDFLIYSLDGITKTINVIFNKNIMTINLKTNFSEYEKFKINVFDGFINYTSEKIYVRFDNTIKILPTENNNTENNNTENNIINNNVPLKSLSDKNINENSINEKNKVKINIVVVVVIMVIAIIFIIIIIIKINKNSNNKDSPLKPVFTTNYNRLNLNQYKNKVPLYQKIPMRKNINPNISNSYNKKPNLLKK